MRIGGDDRLDAALGELTRTDVLACIMWIKRDPESARCQRVPRNEGHASFAAKID